MDPRRDPENLREHLLGGKGLISRTLQRLAEHGRIPAPRESGGSYVPAQNGSARKLVLGDGSDAPILELCEQLREWLGLDPIDFTPYLVRWSVADHDVAAMLLGNVREVVASWTTSRDHVPDKHIEALLGLVTILQNWMGTKCEHSFNTHDVDTHMTYKHCDRCGWICELEHHKWDDVPDGRCEWCATPIDHQDTGRPRRFCNRPGCQKASKRAS